MGSMLVVLVFVALAGVVLWRGCRRLDEYDLAGWAIRFGVVEVAQDDLGLLVRRLRRARTARAIGGAIGILVAALPMVFNVIDEERAADFAGAPYAWAWFLGPAAGALLAEALVNQRPATRVASLSVRRIATYIDIRWYWAVVVGGIAVCAMATAGRGMDMVDPWWLPAGTAAIAVVTFVIGCHQIVRRPALAPGGSTRDLDDALRADGIRQILGPSLVIVAYALPRAAWTVGLTGFAALPLFALSLFAVNAWIRLTLTSQWRPAREPAHA